MFQPCLATLRLWQLLISKLLALAVSPAGLVQSPWGASVDYSHFDALHAYLVGSIRLFVPPFKRKLSLFTSQLQLDADQLVGAGVHLGAEQLVDVDLHLDAHQLVDADVHLDADQLFEAQLHLGAELQLVAQLHLGAELYLDAQLDLDAERRLDAGVLVGAQLVIARSRQNREASSLDSTKKFACPACMKLHRSITLRQLTWAFAQPKIQC